MQFLLTDQEAIEAIRSGTRHENGCLLIRIPASCLQDSAERQYALVFNTDSQTVHWGTRSARLSPLLFSLLQYMHHYGRASIEAVQDAVWQREIEDPVVRNACSRLSSRLLDARIPFSIPVRRGNIFLEEATS